MRILSWLGQTSYYTNDYYYTYGNSSSSTLDPAAMQAMMTFIFVMVLIGIAGYVITALFLGRIFQKAGIESWKAWVPVYNNWIVLEMGGQKGYWAVLAFIPLVGIVSTVFTLIAAYHIGLNFGKEGAFVLLAIFLPLVWLIWLAVDKSTWKGTPLTAQSGTSTPPRAPQPPIPPKTPSGV